MPRISAPTVAAHRAEMESALLAAAESLLAEQGPQAVTLSAVGSRVGIARNSVYEYFISREDLVGAVIEAAFREWSESVLEALDRDLPPKETIEQYARTTLEKIARGDHRAMAALGTEGLPDERRTGIGKLHERLLEPMETALGEMGVDNPAMTARLLQGFVDAGFREIERGLEPDAVVNAVTRLIRSAIGPFGDPDPA